ncbi:MAG: CoA transferase [Propionibacteriales bacterium]|nr:CoA transferase [Propionibacteriales bacterium]
MTALEGVKVVEFASYVAGPYTGALLSDLGADVIKVEAPPHGDPYRGWATGNYSSMFCSLNRSKRSILADLKSVCGLEVARSLVADADIVLENSRPGAMERLGLGYEQITSENPGLIYCSITGFGLSGPDHQRPGYDTVGQAMSGLLSLLTDLDDPQPMGISLSDHLAGLFGAYGVLAALAARLRTGKGQRVDTSLLQSSTTFLAENMARFMHDGGQPPTRRTRARTAQVYAVRDESGAPFVVHLSSPDKFWRSLLQVIDRRDLVGDERFINRGQRIAHREDIQALLDEAFATGSRTRWLKRLWDADVPAAPLNTLDDVIKDEQIRHLGLVQEVEHPSAGRMQLLGSGVNLHGTPTRLGPAPIVGEDTERILAELGFPADYLPATTPDRAVATAHQNRED